MTLNSPNRNSNHQAPLPDRALNKNRSSLSPRPLISIVKATILTVVLIGGIGGGIFLVTHSGVFGWLHSRDDVSSTQQQERAQAFAALTSVALAPVSKNEMSSALDSMQLSSNAKAELHAQLDDRTASVVSTSPAVPLPVSNASTSLVPSPAVMPKPSVAKRLAWVTLWDTDAQDGDVVRLDSEGYSRTITLTKAPVTFAIPVASTGIVRITGIQDGEGGGITVGLSSGSASVTFPIMSVGQVLELKVAIN